MQVITIGGGTSFYFPWAASNFTDYLEEESPWIAEDARTEYNNLYRQAFDSELNVENLESDVQRLIRERKTLDSGCTGQGYELLYETSMNKVLLCSGVGHKFSDILRSAASYDFIIIHEPYELEFKCDRFPMAGLTHIQPRSDLLEDAKDFACTESGNSLRNVGLHIRRGDYNTWCDGRYFYDDSYWLELVRNRTRSEENIYVFTNDHQSSIVSKLESYGCIVSTGSSFQDMARMMFMDCILGPPSTFPIMAKMLAMSTFGHRIDYVQLEPLEI